MPVDQRVVHSCYHCGARLPPSPVLVALDGRPQPFCCHGCATAAQWIRDADLGDYYRLRSDPGARVDVEAADLGAWDGKELLAEHTVPVDGGCEITVLTDGMRCAACAWLVDRALERTPGVLDAGANAVTGRIRVAWDPARTRLSAVLGQLSMLGYRAYLAGDPAAERQRVADRRQWLLRLGIAGLAAMQTMMLSEASYLDFGHHMSVPTRDLFRWFTLLVCAPVVFYSGWPFIDGAWNGLKRRHLGMDVLVAGSTLLAYFASAVATVRGGPHVWFDAAAMFVFLLLLARLLEQRARRIASAQVDTLARARPVLAVRERADGTRESVPLSALRVGDIACVAVGEAVPADGELLDPRALFEEALLTGESLPVTKCSGDPVYAGTHCRETPARLRITGIGTATRLSQLTRLVEQAQAQRPPLAQLADRIGAVFVGGVLLAALAVYLGWRLVEPERAFEVALSLLVVSCPCALSLAVPAALAAASGALARRGILPVRAGALDRLARVTDLVFDKTGTLTRVHPVLEAVEVFDGMDEARACALAAALERDSGHPIAAAFAGEEEPLAVESLQLVAGQGLTGRIEGVDWRLGVAPFAAGRADDGQVWLGDGTRAFARFTMREGLRADAADTLRALRALGLTVHLASGDGAAAVGRMAATLGIDDARARQRPEDKLALVHELQARGRTVAMVGDGLNDAPVLAGADVSLAMGEGAALAQRAADLVLTAPELMRVPAAIALARRTRRIIRENFAWAVGYNLIALPLAAMGRVTPGWAALGMAVSSLVVTLNALRLMRRSREEHRP